MGIFNDLLLEMSIISGINNFETMSLDDFLQNENNAGNTMRVEIKGKKTKFDNIINKHLSEALDTGDAEIMPIDIDALKQKKLEKVIPGVNIAERPEKMLHKSNIIDEKGKLINNEELKKKITKRPDKILGQNVKLQKSGSSSLFYDLTLPSYMGLFVDESTGDFKVVKTCPSAGICSKFCYAAKGGYVMFPASSLMAARTVNYLMNDPEGFKSQVINELAQAQKYSAKKGKTVTLRWHDSGDFLSEKYLRLAFDIAKETPNILHYAYTKQIPLIQKLEAEKPDNFVFNFSFGGKYDEMINPLVDKHSRVVPANLFRDLPQKKTEEGIEFTPTAIDMLKTRTANEYKVNKNSILTYNELMETPLSTDKKWNVLVWKGHGDDAASRKDVLGTYLLIH
jgi:hypothetical protein